ncbi:MAG TPA: hypothetical protein VNR11_13925 [Xanthobacteraceae bacterium]|nr:hypothetical protein [Xanthobacteraceae bacterium]
MSLAGQLKRMAGEIAEQAQQRVDELERQLVEIETRKATIEKERATALLAPQRVEGFPVKAGSDYLCPRCWVENGAISPLHPIASQTSDDVLRCRTCHLEVAVSF